MLVQKLVLKNLDRLAELADLADRPDLDIRPTLLRVLTDLYVQKPSHGPEEELHYVELALRLIDEVDAGTCAAVAASLSRYPNAPAPVMQRLAPIAALGYPKAASGSAPIRSEIAENQIEEDSDLFEPQGWKADAIPSGPNSETPEMVPAGSPATSPAAPADPRSPLPASFVELRESFFGADFETRRLILTSLEAVASYDAPALASGTNLMRYLEQAALAGRRQEFTTLLQQSLGISRALAARIVSDTTGEPFAVAGRALAMPADVFQRILMFLNTEIGRSVQRVYDLADLFAGLPQDFALHLVAIWREADRMEARASMHRPVHWPDGTGNIRANEAQEKKAETDQQNIAGSVQRRA